jgi:membrane-associated phospholipid phosphatase
MKTFISPRRSFISSLASFVLTMLLTTLLTTLLAAASQAHAQPAQPAQPAQVPVRRDAGQIFLSDLSIGWTDALRYYSAPARFGAGEWLALGGVLAGTAGLVAADVPLNNAMIAFVASQRPPVLPPSTVGTIADGAASFGREYGNGVWALGLAGALYLGGLAFENDDVRITGRQIVQALAYAGIITVVLKSALGRARPYVGTGHLDFQPPQLSDDGRLALPSGHATVAFALSSVLAERIGNPAVTVGLYALAAITAWSRMYHTQHWVSDVFLGTAIGISAGLATTAFERERQRERQESTGSSAQSSLQNSRQSPLQRSAQDNPFSDLTITPAFIPIVTPFLQTIGVGVRLEWALR